MLLPIRNKLQLIIRMLGTIGLYVDEEGYVRDQDNYSLITMEGKMLKYVKDEETRVDRNIELGFKPLRSVAILQRLFSYYLNKLTAETGVTFPWTAIFKDKDGRQCLVLQNSQGIKLESGYYYNISLAYIDMILRAHDIVYDLSKFDKKL